MQDPHDLPGGRMTSVQGLKISGHKPSTISDHNSCSLTGAAPLYRGRENSLVCYRGLKDMDVEALSDNDSGRCVDTFRT